MILYESSYQNGLLNSSPPDYKTHELGKRSLQLAAGKDADMVREDNAVPFLCRYDGEVILLYEGNGSLIFLGEDNSMTSV